MAIFRRIVTGVSLAASAATLAGCGGAVPAADDTKPAAATKASDDPGADANPDPATTASADTGNGAPADPQLLD